VKFSVIITVYGTIVTRVDECASTVTVMMSW
jgi:hypothetical protein